MLSQLSLLPLVPAGHTDAASAPGSAALCPRAIYEAASLPHEEGEQHCFERLNQLA